jgi:hypothetical protein
MLRCRLVLSFARTLVFDSDRAIWTGIAATSPAAQMRVMAQPIVDHDALVHGESAASG